MALPVRASCVLAASSSFAYVFVGGGCLARSSRIFSVGFRAGEENEESGRRAGASGSQAPRSSLARMSVQKERLLHVTEIEKEETKGIFRIGHLQAAPAA